MADETQVAAVEAPPAATPAPVETPAPPVTTETPVTPPVETAQPTLSDLEEAMRAGLPADETETPVAPPVEATPAPEFQQMLGISEFVKTPEHVQAAIRAAHEVWQVASGKLPASQMLEAMRTANPQGFQAIFDNLTGYIEQVSGKKLGGAPEASTDPVQQRLNAIEAQFKQQEDTRKQAVVQEQTTQARTVAMDVVSKLVKGSAFEGSEGYLLQRCADMTNVQPTEMVGMLLRGFTKPLETALKAVQKEETARLQRYNDTLIKNYRTLKNAVPATKGGPAESKPAGAPPYLPGETAAQYATRVWNSGLV